MQILTTIDPQDWHWSQAWLECVLDRTNTAQIIVYNQMSQREPMHHPRLAFWNLQEQVPKYTDMVKDINQRLHRALSDGARHRLMHIWRSCVRDICIADFMSRSPYEFAWLQSTAWPEYTLNQDWLHTELHTNDCVLWNHQGHQRTDIMLLGGSHTLRTLTAGRIEQMYDQGMQWLNRSPDLGWSQWLQDWERRVIEGDDAWQFY